MATFVATGNSAVTLPVTNGNVTMVLTNTSSFIGTVFFETSLDGGLTWITPSTPLTSGTMVAGPLTFNLSTPQLAGYQFAQHRLRCSAYTSGTLTYTVTEATASVPSAQAPSTFFAGGIAGTQTNDNALPGNVGEIFDSTQNMAVAGIVATMTTASPTVVTQTAHGMVAGQAVFYTNSGGGIGTGMVVNTNYYVTQGTVTTNTYQLSSTMALALAGTADINVTVAGSGTQTGFGACLLASATAADVIGLNLPAGDYDVEAIATTAFQGSTSQTLFAGWLSTSGASAIPATTGALLAAGAVQFQSAAIVTPVNTYRTAMIRVSLSAPGIIVFAAKSTFSVSTTSVAARLRARRVR